MAYVKDADSRYLHVNQRYQEFFGIAADDVRGRRDEELEPHQTVDGPRLATGTISDNEPLQLEYTVAPFEGRPALAVWRFAVRGEDSNAVWVCGVAAPVAEAVLARRGVVPPPRPPQLLPTPGWPRPRLPRAFPEPRRARRAPH